MLGSPSKIVSPNGAPVAQIRGIGQAVIASVDNATKPTLATIYVNNQYPSESLYAIDSSFAPFGPGGSTGFSYFYNNSSNLGGSVVTVDLDNHRILSFTGQVSTSAPTPVFTQVSTRVHVGNLNPPAIALVEPIQVTASNTLTGAFPHYLSSLYTITPVLSSGNIISTGFPSMTLSGGLYTQTASPSISTVGIVMPVGAWLFTDWISENTGGGDWGPVISDGTNTYQFNMSAATGNISLFRNGVDIYDVTIDVSASTLHSIVFSAAYLGGTTWRLKAWIDGTEYIDFTDSSSLNPNHIYPGFLCTANQVKHLDADFYGSCDNPLKLDNPSVSTAPIISAVSITYPLSLSSSNFYANVSFTVGGSPQSWMEGIRVKDAGGAYVDLVQTSNNQYSALMELNANRVISAAFLDLAGIASAFAVVGTATYPGVVTGSAGSGAAPVASQGATEFSYVENFGTTTFDAISTIYLDSNGTTSDTTLAFIELVSAPTGTLTYTTVGTLVPNASGIYQPVWDNLLNSGTYDLGVRYVDMQGTRGAVYTIGTTVQPPIFVIPQVIPTGIPVAPVVQGGSVSLSALVSQVDNTAKAGSLQDILAKLTFMNVPQDFSVNRALFSFRKYNAAGPLVSAPSIVHKSGVVYSPQSTGNDVLANFDSTNSYAPSVGNLVLIIASGVNPGTLLTGWNDQDLGGSFTHNHAYWKVWDGGDTVGETINTSFSGGQACWVAYEISNATGVTQYVSTNTTALTYPSQVLPTLTPTLTNCIPIAGIGMYTSALVASPLSTNPTFSGGFSFDAFSSTDPRGNPTFMVTGSAAVTSTLAAINCTVGLPTDFSGENGNPCVPFILLVQGTPGATVYPWTDYSYVPLQGLPLPPEEQSCSETYGQLGVGIAYDFAVQYVSVDNVLSPRTIFQSNYLSPITLYFSGTVSTANMVVDSGFTKSLWGQNNAGAIASTRSGINLNWKFFNIDGVNEGSIVKGSVSPSGGTNYLFIPPAGSGITFRAISEPVTVAQAQQWMAQGYIDARTCSGGTTGGAYIAIVDNSGTNTFTTTYAKKAVTPGTNATLSLDTAWTVTSGITEVCFMFHSDEMVISSNGLFFCNPMLENNTIATGYNLGPPDASDGSTRSPLSVVQKQVLNTGTDASTIATSPTSTAGTAAPISGGGAGAFDQQPQGSTRLVQPGSGLMGAIYLQTAFVATSPAWVYIGPYSAGTAIIITSGTINVIPDDLNIIVAQQLFS